MSRARSRSWRIGGLVLAACVACATGGMPVAARAEAAAQISPAERLIFMADHLHGMGRDTELDYALSDSDATAAGTDAIAVRVVSAGNANGDARVFDHGKAVPLPNAGLPCNPAIIYFLEQDIAEMERLTGGKRRYFQQRLRLALAAGPKIETVTTRIGGKVLTARQIVVQPYLADPNAARFARYTGKRYTFLMADSVPGQVAMIRTDVPGPNDGIAHPQQTRTLVFRAMRHTPTPPHDGTKASAQLSDASRAGR